MNLVRVVRGEREGERLDMVPFFYEINGSLFLAFGLTVGFSLFAGRVLGK